MKKIILSVLVLTNIMFAGGKSIGPLAVVENVEDNVFYVGIGVAALSSRLSTASLNFFEITDGQDRLGNFVAHAGYWITEYLAIEARYAAGFQDEDAIEIQNEWSLFLRPTYKFDDDENKANGENYFSVYGLLGYGNMKFKGVNKVSGNVDKSDFQWGLGVSYTFRAISDSTDYPYRDTWTLFADYTSLGRNMEGLIFDAPHDIHLDAVTISIGYHF